MLNKLKEIKILRNNEERISKINQLKYQLKDVPNRISGL